MSAHKNTSNVSKESVVIESFIHIIRGQKVIFDSDLARLYGVPTKVFNQAIKRNRDRFPFDFMFQITQEELNECMRSQFVTASKRNIRHLPYAFTEHGAIMAANVLNSPSAVQMSVFVVRAFMRMRTVLSGHKELMSELLLLEKKLTERLDVHEIAIVDILQRMMELLDPPAQEPAPAKPKIGFHV
jgi:hypothetical protein